MSQVMQAAHLARRSVQGLEHAWARGRLLDALLERSGEELLVKLSGLGRPHPTRGVRRAVQGVGQWLARRHPGLAVVHHNLGEVAAHPLEPEREPG